MDEDLKWVIGLIVTMAAALIATTIGTFRNLAERISRSNNDVNVRIDDVKERYVRRDDLEKHITRFDNSIRDLRTDISAQNARILDAIAATNTGQK